MIVACLFLDNCDGLLRGFFVWFSLMFTYCFGCYFGCCFDLMCRLIWLTLCGFVYVVYVLSFVFCASWLRLPLLETWLVCVEWCFVLLYCLLIWFFECYWNFNLLFCLEICDAICTGRLFCVSCFLHICVCLVMLNDCYDC